jgi:hypothetical protein
MNLGFFMDIKGWNIISTLWYFELYYILFKIIGIESVKNIEGIASCLQKKPLASVPEPKHI